MTAQTAEDLYLSSNGDRWTLIRNSAGNFAVSHQPTPSSGGRSSETEVTTFLSQSGHGPEHQALLQALSRLGMNAGRDEASASTELDVETIENLSRALGRAVAECWTDLSQETQQNLFEAAIKSEGEKIRQQLAVFLHTKHHRTVDAIHSQAMRELDSLGG